MTREAERKRLEEMLEQVLENPTLACPRFGKKINCDGCDFDKGYDCNIAGRYANYLLDNGIGIKPPKELCEKKGDYIFVIDEGDIIKGFLALVGYDYKGEEEVIVYYEDEPHFYKFTDYGKTVFLTREEAEKALRKEDENGKATM